MDLYASLLESMMVCCGHTRLRRGPVYTVSMLALGLAVCLNVLSIIDLLWSLGMLADPYHSDGEPHPQRYVCALLCLALLLNTVLARRTFSVDRPCGARHPATASRVAAPTYVLFSSGLFLITLLCGPP
jgi:hypothetical protein